LDEALDRRIPFMIVFGDEEIQKNVVKVKNMVTKTEVEIDITDIDTHLDGQDIRLIAYLKSEGLEPLQTGTDLSLVRSL